MNRYAYAGVAALMALSGAAGFGSAVYLRPLQPPQQQAATVPPPAPVPAIRTVSWFEGHEAERAAKMAACADNPGVGQHDPECLNAGRAAENIGHRNFQAAAKAALGGRN
jgi:hypothetical protein